MSCKSASETMVDEGTVDGPLKWSSESDSELDSDSEAVQDALDWLDLQDDSGDGIGKGGLSFGGHGPARRPNAHGGLHTRPATNSLQPLSNRSQKFVNHIHAGPLEEWEGRLNVGMSNSVTTAIRGSVRDMAIGRTKTNEKADRATVEQVLDPRTRMVLFKMLNRGVFDDINGCISTGKEVQTWVWCGHQDRTFSEKLTYTYTLRHILTSVVKNGACWPISAETYRIIGWPQCNGPDIFSVQNRLKKIQNMSLLCPSCVPLCIRVSYQHGCKLQPPSGHVCVT